MKSSFQDLINKKANAVRCDYPAPLSSPHEGLSLILEKVEDLKTEVFFRKRKDPFWIRNELADIVAYCQKMAEDLCEADWRLA